MKQNVLLTFYQRIFQCFFLQYCRHHKLVMYWGGGRNPRDRYLILIFMSSSLWQNQELLKACRWKLTKLNSYSSLLIHSIWKQCALRAASKQLTASHHIFYIIFCFKIIMWVKAENWRMYRGGGECKVIFRTGHANATALSFPINSNGLQRTGQKLMHLYSLQPCA